MTKKNADVEWLRYARNLCPVVLPIRAQSILAHIDQLEADLREARNEWESARSHADTSEHLRREAEQECGRQLVGPNVHEIAARMMAAMMSNPVNNGVTLESFTQAAYDAAEALIAEGRRRDGER